MVHVGLGDVRIERSDWVGAEQEFKKALDLDPDNYRAQNAWAYPLHTLLGRPQEAVQLYEELRWREPLDLMIAGNYAYALAQAGRVEEAEKEPHGIVYDGFKTVDGVTLSTEWAFGHFSMETGITGTLGSGSLRDPTAAIWTSC